MRKMLIIGYVWPEPTATAAGSRMLQLIDLFQKNGYQITFVSPAQQPHTAFDLSTIGVDTAQIQLNDDEFDGFIVDLNPDIVMFDRFMMEEQFGWRVSKQCPKVLRLLDSEDLHFLRNERITAIKENRALPKARINSEQAQREIASIYRCDVTLTISEFEMDYLQREYQIPKQQLLYVPFLLDEVNKEFPAFGDRQDLMFIGNFIHIPNRDAVLQLKKVYWPLLKKKMPKARLHIYGGYPNQAMLQLHNEQQGFLVHGRADSVDKVMQRAKICIAPIRFGAGLKGKFIDAMQNGTAIMTTSVGAEGMFGETDYTDCVSDDIDDFVAKTIALYNDELLWNSYQQKGTTVLQNRFLGSIHQQRIIQSINEVMNDLEKHRNQNFIGSMLQHHTLKSTEYMSRWIMEKNRD